MFFSISNCRTGKTIQVAVYIGAAYAASLLKRILLVCPLSLLENWQKEMSRWAPKVPLRIYHGSQSQREAALQKVATSGGMLLTTYGQMVGRKLETSFMFCLSVLDEAHKIKNPATKSAQAIRDIRSKRRLVLTGSPLTNNLVELWALFDYACFGRLLGSQAHFKREWEMPILEAHNRHATVQQIENGRARLEELRALLAPYFLRREKATVQCGPARLACRKLDLVVWLPLTQPQVELAQTVLSESPEVRAALNKTASPLAAITLLKKICDAPALLKPREEPLPSPEQLRETSSKLAFVYKLLPELARGGHRCLVFSQSTRYLDLVEHSVLQPLGIRHLRIDGSVSSAERQALVDRFTAETSIPVMMLSSQVGGLGLNLTAATRVIILDPQWTPLDNQCADRAYRLGQTRDVVVYRLISCGCIEEAIYRRQVFKEALFVSATRQTEPQAHFSRHELKELFTLGDTMRSRTQEQINQIVGLPEDLPPALVKHVEWLNRASVGLSDHSRLFELAAQLEGDGQEGSGAPAEEIAGELVDDEPEFLRSYQQQQQQQQQSIAETSVIPSADQYSCPSKPGSPVLRAVQPSPTRAGASPRAPPRLRLKGIASEAKRAALDSSARANFNRLVQKGLSEGSDEERLAALLSALEIYDADEALHEECLRLGARLGFLAA